MKKVVFVFILAISVLGATAQETFKKGTKLLEASIGFNDNGAPLAVSYEVGVKDNMFNVNKLNLGLGAYAGFYGYSSTVTNFGGSAKTSYAIVAPGIRGLLHYQLIDKLDAYAGPAVGLSFHHATTAAANTEDKTESGIDVTWGFIGGLRYEFTSQWGVFAEFGKASGNATIGVAYKLK